ncbi:cytochrome b/b6 domain-containing protein [Streptomyces sp. NPDC046977]|uniref:cytochrome b/b6 domain-containing protein n=1 Tax=Streptomyces sp. NPDC046977 TaxID=3154703 RepID=UPI0033EF8E2C
MRTNRQSSDSRRNPPLPASATLSGALRTARSPRVWATAGTAAALLVLAFTAGPALRAFLDFGAGVLTLVSLSCTVIWGLVSTDTVFLGPRERLVTQGIHRGLGVAAIGFLILHVTTKVVEVRVTTAGAFLPLGVTGRDGLISLGVLAAYLMILAAATGAMRSIFAAKRHPVRWRILHGMAYASWCAALIHGLESGRAAKPWVIIAYMVCLVGVAIGLVVRLRKLRGESVFPETRERSASFRNLARGGGSGSRRRAVREEGGPALASAYTDPLPPLPGFPTTGQYAPTPPPAPGSLLGMDPAAATAQLPQVPADPQAPYSQQPQQFQQPYPQQPQPGAWDGTPPWGTEVPGGVQETDPLGAERLQPISWQQSTPGPYEGQR